jgi:hypothetical protein
MDHKIFFVIVPVAISLIVILGYFLYDKYKSSKPKTEERFFFQTSKCNPKCSGAYYGKPATFQFTQLSPNGTKCEDKHCGYGMISECDHPECKGVLNKYGNGGI